MSAVERKNDLSWISYKAKDLERSYQSLQESIQQLKTRQLGSSNSNNVSSSLSSTAKANLKARLHKLREAALEDDRDLKMQRITIDQQQRLLDAIKRELLSLKKRVVDYTGSSGSSGGGNGSNSEEYDRLYSNYATLRKTMRDRLVLLRSELQDLNANTEAAFVSRKEAVNVSITYWNGRGLAEPLRLMLAASNIKFNNIFLQKPEDLDALRNDNKLYYEQVPLVEIDDMKLTQSGAAMRYLARRAGMYGDSDKERYTIDLILEGCKDSRSPLGAFMMSRIEMDECSNTFKEDRFFGAWERELNSSKNGLFFARESVADVAVFEVLDYYNVVFGKEKFNSTMKKYPNLLKLYGLVYKFGRISDYIENERNILDRPQYRTIVDATLRR